MQDIVQDIEDLDDDDIEIINLINFGLPRQIYVRSNHFDNYDAAGFRKRFRLSRDCCLHFLAQIEEHLEYPLDINNCVSPINQLLTCLRFYSTGGHLQSIADFAGMHLSTVSRIIVRVTNAIVTLYNRYIKFPRSAEEIRESQNNFFRLSGFPRVVGAIDCTHIKIQSPGGDDAEIFRNRKSYFSINVQMICSANLKITNVVSRWPGSVHDSTIFNNSAIYRNFEEHMYRNCLMLGDGGYPNKSYLLTPLLNPETAAEQRYNESHIRTRNCIERCFGVVKRRFPVLAYGCRLKLETVMSLTVATAILHNLAISMNDEEPPPIPDELDENELEILIENGQIPVVRYVQNEPVGAGALMRRQFINDYFANL